MTTARNSEGAELLPCPFCGPSHAYAYTRDGTDRTVAIRCNGCGATTADFKSDPETFSGEPDAIAAWNRRASPSAAEVQALLKTMDYTIQGGRGEAPQITQHWRDKLAALIPRNPE